MPRDHRKTLNLGKKCRKRMNRRRMKRQQDFVAGVGKQPNNNEYIDSQHWQVNGLRLWRKAYTEAIRWHSEYKFALQIAHDLSIEQHRLKQLQQDSQQWTYETSSSSSGESGDESSEEDYSTSETENNSQSEEVDPEYIKFLAVTHKHRAELKLQREAEKLQ